MCIKPTRSQEFLQGSKTDQFRLKPSEIKNGREELISAQFSSCCVWWCEYRSQLRETAVWIRQQTDRRQPWVSHISLFCENWKQRDLKALIWQTEKWIRSTEKMCQIVFSWLCFLWFFDPGVELTVKSEFKWEWSSSVQRSTARRQKRRQKLQIFQQKPLKVDSQRTKL